MANTLSPLNSLEETLDTYFGQKAPSLPPGVREFIVKIAPWLILISVILSIPALLALFGISAVVLPMSGYYGYNPAGPMWIVSMVLLAITVVLEALAIPGLLKRNKFGWNLIFYSVLVSLLSNLVIMNLLGLVIGALISFYLLFQIRSYYH